MTDEMEGWLNRRDESQRLSALLHRALDLTRQPPTMRTVAWQGSVAQRGRPYRMLDCNSRQSFYADVREDQVFQSEYGLGGIAFSTIGQPPACKKS